MRIKSGARRQWVEIPIVFSDFLKGRLPQCVEIMKNLATYSCFLYHPKMRVD